MVVCIVIYVSLLIRFLLRKNKKLPEWCRDPTVFKVMFLMNSIAFLLFVSEWIGEDDSLVRNPYGGGTKTQAYRVSVDGAIEDELVVVEVGAMEYSEEEVREMFQNVMGILEQGVLGENESRDHVDSNLNLMDSVDGYPISIDWELEPYGILDTDGSICTEELAEHGTIVTARATLSYGKQEAIYITNFMVYPKMKTEKELWMEEIEEQVADTERATREEERFYLPEMVAGKKLLWSKEEDTRGYDVLFLGGIVCVLLIWRRKQNEKEAKKMQQEQMQRDYPDILSKFTLLLETGMTLKAAWRKIVENYEEEKNICGKRQVYEEMSRTLHEMNGGVSEVEAYERFGKRCELVSYMKFGALLSQNLRKGSKGLADLLHVEAMQAFETRKTEARKRGEEASAKLLVPMMAMLAVVLVMVIVPAFLSIQL